MKTRALALAALALLAITAVAFAGTNKLTGKFKGDPNSRVTLKIKTNKQGTATKVTAVSVKNVSYKCQGIPGRSGGELSRSWRVNWTIEQSGGRGAITFSDSIAGRGDDAYRFDGRLKNRKGRSVTGKTEALFDQASEDGYCQITNAKFSAKVK